MPYTIHQFATLPSTNGYVKENAAILSHGDVVVAQTQTEGRGRQGRKWVSGPGGLYFTICLKPPGMAFLANMTQLLCLAICRAVKGTGVKTELKWPNDVLVRGTFLRVTRAGRLVARP